MIWFNDKISIRQLQILLILNIFGTGVILLPRFVAQKAGHDGWILIIPATILAIFCIYIITTLGRKFPTHSFYEYSSIILSKPIGFILSIGFILRLVFNMALQLRMFGEIIKQTMLYNTPFFIICLIILLVSGFASTKGYETRGRVAEVLFIIIFCPITLIFLIAAFDVDFTNIMPILETTPPEIILQGGFYTLSAFIGIELILMVYPYVSNYNNVQKGTIHAVTLLGIFMMIITIITISRFGAYDIDYQMWPIIEMMDSTALPGSFLQRQGVFIMSFFIISLFTVINSGLFFSSIILKSIIKKGRHSYYIAITILLTFLASLAPNNMIDVYRYMDILFITLGLGYMLVIPSILLVVAKMRGLGENYGK